MLCDIRSGSFEILPNTAQNPDRSRRHTLNMRLVTKTLIVIQKVTDKMNKAAELIVKEIVEELISDIGWNSYGSEKAAGAVTVLWQSYCYHNSGREMSSWIWQTLG